MRLIPLFITALTAVSLSFSNSTANAQATSRKQRGLVALFHSDSTLTSESNYIGTGFVIEGDWVVTARHVIERTTTLPHSVSSPLLTIRPMTPMSLTAIGIVPNSLTCPTPQGRAVDVCFIQLVKTDARASELEPFTEFACLPSNDQEIELLGLLAGEDQVIGPYAGRVESVAASRRIPYLDGESGELHSHLARSTFSSAGGLSGSPIFLRGSETIIGIHNGRVGDLKYFTPWSLLIGTKLTPNDDYRIKCGTSWSAHRNVTYVMKYLERNITTEGEEEVRRLVMNGMSYVRSLVGDTTRDNETRAYLDEIQIVATDDPVSGYKQLKKLRDDPDQNILQIFYGELVPSSDQNVPFFIQSTAYLGELAAEAGLPYTKDEYEIISSGRIRDFRRTADGHQIVTLYAMLLEAIRTDQPDHLLLGLFALADQLLNDLVKANQLTGDLVDVSDAIGSLKTLRGI